MTRKRSAEIDAERLEEGTAETAETDFGQRTVPKRKAEGDPSDSSVEDSAMNWLAEVWHKENDPDGEVDLLTLQQRDCCVASVHGRRNKPYYRSRLVVQECERQADWSFFTATPPLDALRSLLICATIEELPNDVRQPVAWTEPVVLMLIIVRRAHFDCAARWKVFVELPPEACTDKSKVGRLLRCMYGCRDAGVNWKFAICQVMIAIGFVQGRASPCIYHHLERQLRVWVHGDDFVPLLLHNQCQMVFRETAGGLGCSRIEESLGLQGTTAVCRASECWAGSWNGPLMASLGKQILDMQNSSGSRSE